MFVVACGSAFHVEAGWKLLVSIIRGALTGLWLRQKLQQENCMNANTKGLRDARSQPSCLRLLFSIATPFLGPKTLPAI